MIAVPIALLRLRRLHPAVEQLHGAADRDGGASIGGLEYFAYDGRGWQEAVITSTFLVVFVLAVWAFGDLRRSV